MTSFLLALSLLTQPSDLSRWRVTWERCRACPPWLGENSSNHIREGERCIVFGNFNHTLSWDDAESYCTKHGGILLKENAGKRYVFPSDTLQEIKERDACFWIGLTDRDTVGIWHWSDGERLTGDGWSIIEKLSSWVGDRLYDCAALCIDVTSLYSIGEWFRESCSKSLPPICQYDADAPQERVVRTTPRPTAESKVHHNRRYTFVEVKIKRNFRLTSSPDWSVRAANSPSCARECRNRQPGCVVFNYNTRTRECNVFNSAVKDAVCEQDWTLWKAVLHR